MSSQPTPAFLHQATSALRAWMSLYVDGFCRMTWGRTLWVIILIKLVVIFVVLRLFFFQPYLQGSQAESAESVGATLLDRAG